tara:strand:+ start:184 stop:285 length:102 start_codon:yes stop_codon:yes gene_type:complete
MLEAVEVEQQQLELMLPHQLIQVVEVELEQQVQ